MFDWIGFSRKFPFGDLSISQENYEARVVEAMHALEGEQKAVLLDLLDLQWTCFLEQLRLLHAKRLTPDLHGPMDNAVARMRIGQNLRSRSGLRPH